MTRLGRGNARHQRSQSIAIALLLVAGVPRASDAAAPDRVLTYIAQWDTPTGDRYEWHVLDPVRRTDELFRSFGSSARGFAWDSTESYVEYSESGTPYRVEWEEEAQPWPLEPDAAGGGAPLGLSRLQARMAADTLGAGMIAIPPPGGESAVPFDWYFIPFRSAPERGVALRIRQHPPRPEKTPFAPFYLLDRGRGTQRLLETPGLGREDNASGLGFFEREGFLLVLSTDPWNWRAGTRNYVFDLGSGDQIFHPPPSERITMVWIRRPRPARVDVAGLRRLRERFR